LKKNPVVETDMGKPLSKASKGGDCDILWEIEGVTKCEVGPVSEKHVLLHLRVRLEASPTGLPVSVY
jgi:hypothetical protein